MHMNHTIHNFLQNRLCIDTISTGVVKLATTSKALRQGEAGDFSENIDLIYDPDMDSDHYSDSIKLFDLRSPLLDLRVTVYPDSESRPVGVCHSTTSAV